MQLNHFRRYSTKVDKTRLFLQKAREARDTIDEYLPYPSRAAAARMLFITRKVTIIAVSSTDLGAPGKRSRTGPTH
jgi:hypothetical protein